MEIPEKNNQIEQNMGSAESYENLRQEIKEIKEFELKNKSEGKVYNPHFDNIDPAELIDEDFKIYQKFKDKSLTLREILEYKKIFAKVEDLENDPRGNFMAWLVNQISSPEWTERWNSGWKKEK